RSDQFFDALFGDASEGAYDIRLAFNAVKGDQLIFHFELHQRPGKCLACNLTYGLPKVFERHPIINTKEVVEQLCGLLNGKGSCSGWKLDKSIEISQALHVVPLIITVDPS
ncbi:MAG: pancreas/duodenum homeobox protein 1, partial [Desulfobacteraceae bacterium]